MVRSKECSLAMHPSTHNQIALPAGVLHCWFLLHQLAKVIVRQQRHALFFQASLVLCLHGTAGEHV